MNQEIDIAVRAATIDDLPAIFHLGEKVFTSRDKSNLYRSWDEFEVTSLFNTEPEFLLVAESSERIVGFAMGSIVDKARSAWTYGHLLWLGVEPDFARAGVGSRLFDSFRTVMESHGVRMLMVDTQADNMAAIRFFVDKGFQNPTDHVYMTLNLGMDSG